MQSWNVLKNHKVILGGIFILGLAFILGNFLVTLSFPDSSYNFLGKTREVTLDPGKPVTQVFTAQDNHFNQLKILIGNTEILPGEKVVFELADATCQDVLAQDTYRFSTLSPHIYYHFNFPEIPDSRGKTYCLRVTYFSPFDRDSDDRPSLDATRDEETAFMGWSYFDGDNGKRYENRTLKMRPAYGTGSFWNDLNMFNNRLSQYKPDFAKGNFLTLFGLLILGCSLFAYQVIRSTED